MNHLERYLVALLQNNIFFEGVPIPVRRQFTERSQIPCITLDTGSISTGKVFRETTSEEIVVTERVCTLYLNLWCNTEEEREAISENILNAFWNEQTGHYQYCTNYNPDNQYCTYLNMECQALTTNNARTLKNQCPYPSNNNYESLQVKENIIQGSINIEPPVIMDEKEDYPPLLRNRFDVEASYYDIYTVGGVLLEEININDILTI